MMVSVSLLLILAFTVSVSEANYEFTIRFYEFRNTLGLQCGACGNGGPPACCDHVQQRENCNMTKPFTCDTRFRFLLRPFGASVETAPSGGFPYFTPSNGGNSDTFNEAPGGFLARPNPFTINSMDEWTGRIQFFVDALDRAVSGSGLTEVEVIINRFPIDLELELGAAFTERTTYTGIYNISGLGFDMSFRVQCSDHYYGPNCTTFCEPMEGVYTCDSEGVPSCLQGSQNSTTFCSQCLSSWNPSLSCAMCLDPSTNCTTCHNQTYDPSTNCTTCLGFLDPQTNCIECVLFGYDPASGCTTCLPDFIQVGNNCSRLRVESTEEVVSAVTSDYTSMHRDTLDHIDPTDGGLNLALVVGAAGGGLAALVMIVLLILCILIVIIRKRKRTNYDISDAAGCPGVTDSFTYTKKTTSGLSNTPQHDFKNPIYGPSSASAPDTNKTTDGEEYPLEQLVEVPNPFYGEFADSASQEGSKQGSQTSLNKADVATPRSRLATFPYVMDGAENMVSNGTPATPAPHNQQRERVEHVVYEMADIVTGKPTMKVENGMYDTADNVCGKPVRADVGKSERAGVVPQGEEYDEIKTSGTKAAMYDDIIVSGKSSVDVKVNRDTSAPEYDDILMSNTSGLHDDVKVVESQALYDDVVKTSTGSPSEPTTTGNDEYDDIIKGPRKPSSGAVAKPSGNNAFTHSGKGE